MRCGWIRPSLTSRSRVRRPISRRTGSKHDRSTASGVSSMIRLTPVTDSKARMLRPSRPMILPFISSPGRCMTETTDSLVCSTATRWMASVTILRARLSASDLAVASMSLIDTAASRLAWFSIVATSSAFAWSAVRRGDPLKLGLGLGVGFRQGLRPLVELGPALFECLPACLKAAALVVEPLLALADPLLAPLQVTAELAHLVLDGADLVLDLAAAVRGLLRRLLGRLGGPAEDPVGVGLRARPDLLRFGLGLDLRLAASSWAARCCSVLTAAWDGGNRRKTTANAPNARANATSPITKSASAPLTVTPFVPLVTEPWRYG